MLARLSIFSSDLLSTARPTLARDFTRASIAVNARVIGSRMASSAPHPVASSSTVGQPAALPIVGAGGSSGATGTQSDGPGSPKSMQSSIHSHQGGKAHGKKDGQAKKPKASTSLTTSMAQLEVR